MVSLIFVSLLAVVMILVMVTMLGLKKRCGKAEMYRPVYSGGQPGGPDMYQHQPLNISYIDLYSHCNPATGDNHKLLVAANSEVSRYRKLDIFLKIDCVGWERRHNQG